MPDITFNCPHCRQSIEAPEEMAGTTSQCPMCQKDLQVPRKSIALKHPADTPPRWSPPPVSTSLGDNIEVTAEMPSPKHSPLISVACPNCGSPKVTEFKTGSYVCGNCETTFKWVDPSRQTIVVKGTVNVSSGTDCTTCAANGRFQKAAGVCCICGTHACATHGNDGSSEKDIRRVLAIEAPLALQRGGALVGDPLLDDEQGSSPEAYAMQQLVRRDRDVHIWMEEINKVIHNLVAPIVDHVQTEVGIKFHCHKCFRSLIQSSLRDYGPVCPVCKRPVTTKIPVIFEAGCDHCRKFPIHTECRLVIKVSAIAQPSLCFSCAREIREAQGLFGGSKPGRYNLPGVFIGDFSIEQGADKFTEFLNRESNRAAGRPGVNQTGKITSNGKGKIRVTRIDPALGAIKIFVDDRQVGALKRGESVTVDVRSGNHLVVAKLLFFSSEVVKACVPDGEVIALSLNAGDFGVHLSVA